MSAIKETLNFAGFVAAGATITLLGVVTVVAGANLFANVISGSVAALRGWYRGLDRQRLWYAIEPLAELLAACAAVVVMIGAACALYALYQRFPGQFVTVEKWLSSAGLVLWLGGWIVQDARNRYRSYDRGQA